eukprot:scaffold5992_cov158-Ochromonas_danica.AAC.1
MSDKIRERSERFKKSATDRKVGVIVDVIVPDPPPALPVDAQGLTADDIKEDRKRIRDLKYAYDNAKFVVYTWLKQQCTPSMIGKLKENVLLIVTETCYVYGKKSRRLASVDMCYEAVVDVVIS